MHCLTVTYSAPADAARFKAYYETTHVPLARQLPGLKSCLRLSGAARPRAGAVLHFSGLVRGSRRRCSRRCNRKPDKRVAEDVPNYSPDGATLFHFPVGA